MKKLFEIIAALTVVISLITMAASASQPSKDGIYEVTVQLKHAEKDTVSMGNSYILHTALLEIKNGTKYITIVSDSEVMNLEFSYYTDGSVTGSTQSAEKIENIKIGGKIHSVGYKFPLKGTGQLVGVKFKASIMPLSPSARLSIDYDSCKLVSASAETTEVTNSSSPSIKPTENRDNKTASESSNTTAADAPSGTKNYSSVSELYKESETITSENFYYQEEQPSVTESFSDVSEKSEENTNNSGLITGVAITLIIITAAAAFIVKQRRK